MDRCSFSSTLKLWRATFFAGFTGVVFAFLVSGCATVESASDQQQFTWDGPPSDPIARFEWVHASPKEVQESCSFKYETEGGCVIRLYGHPKGPTCLIYSTLAEQDAHRRYSTTPTGRRLESHWEHEVVEHCFKGKNHRRA